MSLSVPRFTRVGPVVLCILDGVGIGSGGEDDAVARARTPNLNRLRLSSARPVVRDERGATPFLSLQAHGKAVGLPSDDDMGNSEVGHNAIGAGRVFDQGAKLVDAAFATGDAWRTPVWQSLIAGRTLHLIGLLSDGNVHSNVSHLRAIVLQACRDGVSRVRIHILTDGRDVAARSALTWIEPLESWLQGLSIGGKDYRIASGGGRMWITMDRYGADWPMVERGWRCHVEGQGRQFARASDAVRAFYAEDPNVNDQWLPAFVVAEDGQPVGRIDDGDAVLLFNFRGDRAIEISQAFDDPAFTQFPIRRPAVYYAGLMQYDGDLMLPANYLVRPPAIDRCVGEYLVGAGLRSFVCSETQKFGHVTFFFNGNRSGMLDEQLERYVEVPSDRLPFAERPWMKAAEIADEVIAALASGKFDHLRLNFANGDMVGHTGNLTSTIMAIEAVDLQVGRLAEATARAGGILLVTADHGNADEMFMHGKGGTVQRDANGAPLPKTSHTLNPVPFLSYDASNRLELADVQGASIASVGTTVLELCGLARPDGYEPGLVVPR